MTRAPTAVLAAYSDCSGSATWVLQQVIAQDLNDVLFATIADRMAVEVWGTDITRMPCSWRQCVTLFTEELPWLKGRDLELVMGRAVCDWPGWKR